MTKKLNSPVKAAGRGAARLAVPKARVAPPRPLAAASGAATGVAAEELVSLYKEMLFYRRFEERVLRAYQKSKFAGFCHLHIGQEAVCVGVQRALRPSDYFISGYRSHTQALAKGLDPGAVMAELFGKADGCVRGKGGSMHMFSREHRFLGGHGIVGGQTPIAAGVAFAIKYNGADDVIVCALGDAATNQGAFFEAMNMAATWKLPVLYLIENNQYGMGTDIRRTTSVDRLSKRALAFDMERSEVDGMDVLTVQAHMKPLIASMREDPRPHLCEAITYRYRGHSVSDPATYRTKEEVQEWMDRDPIARLGQRMEAEGVVTAGELAGFDDEARARVDEVEAFADASPPPPVDEAWRHVYATTEG